jgi:hypothetical protein
VSLNTRYHTHDVLVGYASTQLPQLPLTPPEADAFVSGEGCNTVWSETKLIDVPDVADAIIPASDATGEQLRC